MDLQVLGTEVALSCEQHLDVLRRRIEGGREVVRSHVGGVVSATLS